MKKRLTCLVLALLMLVGLLPTAVLSASAASLKTSEAAITVLKKMTTFSKTCKQFGTTDEFRIGYDTVCNETGHKVDTTGKDMSTKYHTITEAQADKALRKALEDFDKKVNSFASANKLTLTQQQHDALVLFSYDCGTAWMDGQGLVKTAVVNKAGASELLNAMSQWAKGANLSRRKIEVNMYINGVYSNVPPTSYATVTYDPNGGYIPQGATYTAQFDTTVAQEHLVTPTNGNQIFMGWYLDGGKSLVTKLTSICAGQILKAQWQDKGLADSKDAGIVVDYYLQSSQLATKTIYNWPNLKASGCKENGKVTESKVHVDRDYVGQDGTRWARIGDYKWVIVKAGSNGTGNYQGDIDVTVTVTNSFVNSRVNATVHCATNGSYKKGQQLRIINTANADGFLWGQVAKSADDSTPIGWVALMYTNWNAVKDDPANNGGANGGNNSNNNSKVLARATITFNGYVNVRNEAGTDGKIVGSLAQNETVDVYEIKTVNGHRWGRTTSGWFCMTYANVTMLQDNISDAGAMNYTFTGKANGTVTTRVAAGEKSATTGYTIPNGTAVTLTNLAVVGSNETWAKAVWSNPEKDKNGKDITVTRSGWVPMPVNVQTYGSSDDGKIVMDPVKFTVVSDEVSVREEPGNGSKLVATLNKGVEVSITDITLVGENIWGYTVGEMDTDVNGYAGYVNLATKYFKRSNPVEAPKEEHGPTVQGKSGTVINTDSLKVRETGATYGKILGTLSRGTTVKVWEENGGWYKVDSNKNGVYDYEGDGWVSGNYLNVFDKADNNNSGSGSNGGTTTSETGTGVVANTYSGVKVRSGPGTSYGINGVLQPGTAVKILEVKQSGAAKWGRTEQGWVCMDYITMVTYDPSAPVEDPSKGNAVESLDKVDKTTTTAVYTGTVTQDGVSIRKEPNLNADIVRTVNVGDPITMYELVKVTDYVSETNRDENAGGTVTQTTKTSYWARVNEGYIYNPAQHLDLTALDEKVHTLTGSDTLNIRVDAGEGSNLLAEGYQLKKGEQVKVTALKIVNDKVWGRIETEKGTGWIRLDYMSEGAYYVPEKPATPPTTPTNPNPGMGNTGNTGSGGFVPNAGGYKYTGKIIRANEVNVRSTASTSSSKTTTLKEGASVVIYETTISENMAWGRCDAGWIYLYYVDLTPCTAGAVDARVVYNDNTIIYSDANGSSTVGTYARMSVIDIYEIVGKMARTDQGWVHTDNLL